MHAGNPEDGVAEGGVYSHDQLPQSMRLRDLGGDVESGKGDGNPLEPATEHRRYWNRDEERIKREVDELRGRSHPPRHRRLRGRAVDQPPEQAQHDDNEDEHSERLVNPAEPVRGGGIERIAVALAQRIGGENQHDGQPMEGPGAGAVARGSAAQTDYLSPILSLPQRLTNGGGASPEIVSAW